MLEQVSRIHFIGIGGIGISALAELWRAQGKIVTGSDAESRGHRAKNVVDTELVIYSDAVQEDNVERREARRRGIPELSYAQVLGEVSREYRTMVVTGTHGKSTTTALLGLMLEAAGMDPLVIVGTRVREWGNSNIRISRMGTVKDSANGLRPANYANNSHNSRREAHSRYPLFVVEGDDYRDHFLELSPYAVVVTNIEWDHPDYFRDLEHTVESFKKLVEKVPEDGFVLFNEDDPGCQELITQTQHPDKLENVRMIRYGSKSSGFADLPLQIPGTFNRYNAIAAATAAIEFGVSQRVVENVVRDFKGVWRRFEIVGEAGGATIVSDYGHHPTAIRATMNAARELYSGRRLMLVYQPHQHSRTKHLLDDFVKVFKDAADLVIVSDIYAVKGRLEDQDINSRMLVDRITRMPTAANDANIFYGGNLEDTKRIVLEKIQPGDVVIFMGAGDIDQVARDLAKGEDYHTL